MHGGAGADRSFFPFWSSLPFVAGTRISIVTRKSVPSNSFETFLTRVHVHASESTRCGGEVSRASFHLLAHLVRRGKPSRALAAPLRGALCVPRVIKTYWEKVKIQMATSIINEASELQVSGCRACRRVDTERRERSLSLAGRDGENGG